MGGVIYYINDDEGRTYEVQSGKVDAIEYSPAKRYSHLYCGDTSNQRTLHGRAAGEGLCRYTQLEVR